MADDATRVKTITDNLEGTYQAMRRAASNIAGLLQLGRATCDEVRAYNLWALALYNEQRGMLETLRAAGQTGIPALPPAPTLFTWRGVQGADAWKVDCAGQASSLSGAMASALRGPGETAPQFLSTNELAITTQDQFVYDPESSPSFSTLLAVQNARAAQQSGLGVAPLLLIVIGGIAISAVAAAVVAIARYLETKEIQESNSRQVKLQADAFANYTSARLTCYADCTKQGGSTEKCVELCQKIVEKPNIKLPGQTTKWGVLQWTGFLVIAGGISYIGYRIYKRRQEGKPLFELPDFDTATAP